MDHLISLIFVFGFTSFHILMDGNAFDDDRLLCFLDLVLLGALDCFLAAFSSLSNFDFISLLLAMRDWCNFSSTLAISLAIYSF